MQQGDVLDDLQRQDAWPQGEQVEEVKTTHASVVFLTASRAWKIKKAVDLGFLDYTTLEARRHFCEAEVRLNRPRAPGVYLHVVPIAAGPGGVRVGGRGEVVEWAVEMRRLPDETSLLSQVEAGKVDPELLDRVGRRLAAIHRDAERSPRIAEFGRAEVVRRNTLENFDQSRPDVGTCVSAVVHARLEGCQRDALAALGPLMDRRVDEGRPCDTHGDLRLEHAYVLEGREIAFIDCIEFNERFRYADPVADLAFLYMDLAVRGERGLADVLAEAWFSESGDEAGRALLPFWSSYRSTVRAKVAGMLLRVPNRSPESAREALDRARRHWLFALGELAPASERQWLVGIGGLPGTGKSTLATELARDAGFEVVRSDVVRKELAHLSPSFHPTGRQQEALYADEMKDRVYGECLSRASSLLFEGRRVAVDASFWKERWRVALLDAARAAGVPAALVRCEASRDTVRDRLARRKATGSDPSDADFRVYEQALREWEPEGSRTGPVTWAVASTPTAAAEVLGNLTHPPSRPGASKSAADR